MNDMAERRRWFRSFPEGTLEFLVVTRILTVLMVLALAAVREAQRPMVLLALGMVLLLDYVLTIWWLVQTSTDVDDLRAAVGNPSGAAIEDDRAGRPRSRGKFSLTVLACLPAVAAFVALAPWAEYAISNTAARAAAMRVLAPAAGIAFILFIPFGYKALCRIGMRPRRWLWPLLIPGLHWFALHRIVARLRRDLDQLRPDHEEGPSFAIPIADATWVLAILPWMALALTGAWRYVPPCGAVLAALFLIADVAAMEGVQRQLLGLLRRTSPATRS